VSQEVPTDLTPARGATLVALARQTISAALTPAKVAPPDKPDEDWLQTPGASFVTLHIAEQLRGCIGSLIAHRPLGNDVRSNARAAAFADPRFPPVTAAELAAITIEVSVLSAPIPLTFTSRADALANLRPGVDGVILTARGQRATFLPQVWEELPDPEVFIAHLMRKAGLPATFWDDSVRLERYTVTAFEEPNDPSQAD
jgi:AmmeMemoRadiSam system protein A